MRKFFEKIVKLRKLALILFSAAFIICFICRSLIPVDYDMNDYLPSDSPSTVALDIMEQEYEGGIPNARVMVSDVTVPEALEYKSRIAAVDGVADVTWLDDSASVTQPFDFIDQDTLDTYYKDGNALFSVTLDADKRVEAVKGIREIIGDDNAMTGGAVSTAVATESTVKEIPKIAVGGIAFAFLVLFLTTTSWAEPFIIMIGLGVAVIINAGSNIMFGEISFVTNAAGRILQMAVSLDYSVFLLHRFEECRKDHKGTAEGVETSMVDALCASCSSILASGLTTVIGFLALCLMRFRIGPDLGLALAKGIAISLLTVFIFMPALILATYRLIDKTRHRSFMPSFGKFGRLVCRMMVPMICAFVLIVVPAYMASNSNSFYFGASHIFGPGTQLGSDTDSINEAFGKKDTYVLMVPRTSTATERELSDSLHAIPQVKNIISYVDSAGETIPEEYLDEGTNAKLNSENYTRMVISVSAALEGDETFGLVDEIRSTAEEYYPGEWFLAGEGVSTKDLRDTVTSDMIKVNLVAIGAVFLVLLLTMKSLVLPVILVLCIETAIWINLAIPYFAGRSVFYIAYLIISSIQLGATVDYAILFTDRYKEFRRETGRKDAVVRTISAVTVSIMTSGSVLTVVGFLMGVISSHGLLAQLGMFLGKGTICSMIIVFFVLPGMLWLFDGIIRKTTRGVTFADEGSADTAASRRR